MVTNMTDPFTCTRRDGAPNLFHCDDCGALSNVNWNVVDFVLKHIFVEN